MDLANQPIRTEPRRVPYVRRLILGGVAYQDAVALLFKVLCLRAERSGHPNAIASAVLPMKHSFGILNPWS